MSLRFHSCVRRVFLSVVQSCRHVFCWLRLAAFGACGVVVQSCHTYVMLLMVSLVFPPSLRRDGASFRRTCRKFWLDKPGRPTPPGGRRKRRILRITQMETTTRKTMRRKRRRATARKREKRRKERHAKAEERTLTIPLRTTSCSRWEASRRATRASSPTRSARAPSLLTRLCPSRGIPPRPATPAALRRLPPAPPRPYAQWRARTRPRRATQVPCLQLPCPPGKPRKVRRTCSHPFLLHVAPGPGGQRRHPMHLRASPRGCWRRLLRWFPLLRGGQGEVRRRRLCRRRSPRRPRCRQARFPSPPG